MEPETLEAVVLTEIEAFLRRSGMKPTRFGLEAMGDGRIVSQLRLRKRSLTLRNADKVLAFIRTQDQAKTASTTKGG